MTLRVLDPTNEMKGVGGQPAARPSSLQGKTVGFISNGKEGTPISATRRMLREKLGVGQVIWRTSRTTAHRRHLSLLKYKMGRGRHRCWRLRQLLIVQFA
jgi:hypothetical protein